MSWIAVGVAAATTTANMVGQAQKEKSDKKLAASTAKWSPWTGLKPNEIHYANPAGSIASGVATGFGVKQGLNGMQSPGGPSGSEALTQPELGSSMKAASNESIGNPQFGIGLPGSKQMNSMAGWQNLMNPDYMQYTTIPYNQGYGPG